MGQINCHCSLETRESKISEEPIKRKPTLKLTNHQRHHRKVKSRVNSILSPRQLLQKRIAQHLNAPNNFNNMHNKQERCKIQIKANELYETTVEINEIVTICGLFQNNIVSQMENYDLVIKSKLREDTWSFSAKINEMNCKLEIKSNKMGLGVFKWVKQDMQVRLQHTQMENSPEVFDVGIGHFIIIKSISKNGSIQKMINCMSIMKNSGREPTKIARSLPAIIGYPEINNEQNFILTKGQSKLLSGKFQVSLEEGKIIIKAYSEEGLYRYLSHYEQIARGDILRLGTKLYQVNFSQNQTATYILSPKF